MTPLPPDFSEFLKLLNAHEVRYLLVGGYAVIAHGLPRTTKDVDVWIEPTPENAQRILEVLEQFGFGGTLDDPGVLTRPGRIVRMGVYPFAIELFTSIRGLPRFDDCYTRRVTLDLAGVAAPVLAVNDLIDAKTAAGRPQDLADVDRLRKRHEP